jgi:hypothetical protein
MYLDCLRCIEHDELAHLIQHFAQKQRFAVVFQDRMPEAAVAKFATA